MLIDLAKELGKMVMGKDYDEQLPLISLHIPKAGGQSLKTSLKSLVPAGFRIIEFYPDYGITLPADWNNGKTIIHGHFLRWNNHAVEDIIPQATQFTTVVREPFDTIISNYVYGLQNNFEWATSLSIDEFLGSQIQSKTSPLLEGLPALDGRGTIEEYVRRFILVGVVDHLAVYVERLGEILGSKIAVPGRENVSRYTLEVPDRRDECRKAFPLDYELYEYVKSLYAS